MVCGGFVCSKNALIALNTFYLLFCLRRYELISVSKIYQFVSAVLIGVGAYAKAASIIPSLSITGGIVAAGVFLLLVALLGVFGASRHHQVFLFFYMIILFIVFLIQFFVAVACLAVTDDQIKAGLERGWKVTSNETICFAEEKFECCHYKSTDDSFRSPNCTIYKYNDCKGRQSCDNVLFQVARDSLQVAGAFGLFFSFTETVGIWLAMRFRNLKDPRANPNAFL